MSRTRFAAGPLAHVDLNAALDELETLALGISGAVTYTATVPAMDGTAAAGVATTVARSDHVHPSDTSRLAVASNLADLGSASSARSNLGLGAVATLGLGTGLQSVAGALRPDYGLVAGILANGIASAGVSGLVARIDHVHPTDTSRLAAASNLSDVASVSTARTNLGLAAIATLATAAQGSVVIMGAAGPAVLAPGTSGNLLQTNGASANPTWVAPPSGTGGASLGSANPLINGTAAAGTSTFASHEDHVHPTDTTRAPLDAPTFTTRIVLPSYAAASLPAVAVASLAYDSTNNKLRVSTGAAWETVVTRSDASSSTPAMNGTGAAGSSTQYAKGDHVHPTDTSRLAAASNLLDVANAATARSNLGVAASGCTWSFGLAQVVANGNLVVDIPYGFTLNSLVTNVGSNGGSFSVTVSIGGTPVTGMNAIAVSSSTDSTATATGANTGSAGQVVVTIASTTGAPTDSKIILRWTR